MNSQRLTFIRHAHASSSIVDITRPLSPEGLAQAQHRAASLKDQDFDLIIISAALRTRQTAEIILEAQSHKAPIEEVLELYIAPDRENSTVEEILEIISSRISKHNAKNILIVGHANIINELGHLRLPSDTELLMKPFKPAEGFCIEEDDRLIMIQN